MNPENESARTRIVNFDQRYVADFERLNREWLEELFRVEPFDEALFTDPLTTIIAPGGQILFALWRDDRGEEQVVGTCALLHDAAANRFELAKMGVTRSHQGRGIGRQLLDAAIEHAKRAGATEVILLSNSKLVAALQLYRRAGFQIVRTGPHPRYERVDIELTLSLTH